MGLDYINKVPLFTNRGVATGVPNRLAPKGGGFGQMRRLGKDRSVAPGSYRVGSRGAKTENTVAMIDSRAKHIQLPNLVP